MGLIEDHPKFYQAWVADKGIENAFKVACLAAKVEPASEEDLMDFTKQCLVQALGILENIDVQRRKPTE